jgi:hypothetical protein
MSARKTAVRVAVLALVASIVVVAPRVDVSAVGQVIPTRAEEVHARVDRATVFPLPFAAQHIALHWPGHHRAQVSVELSRDGLNFESPVAVQPDEVGEGHPSGEFYGAVIAAEAATHVRVVADRPVGRLSVVAMVDGEPRGGTAIVEAGTVGAQVAQPAVVTRAEWRADETYRFRRQKGKDVEVWPPDFHRVQKLVVHHTATANVDTPTEAMAELRAIYYYHAVTQGWGDIGYNFIVDQMGTVYEGRYSAAPAGAPPTGEDAQGRVVTAGHTYQHNVGTVGVAVLGDTNLRPLNSVVRDTLVEVLSWLTARHHLDPDRTATYRNVVNDIAREATNIAGHRDYVATACPGEGVYSQLTDIRARVLAASGVGDGDVTAPAPPPELTAAGGRRQVVLSWQPSPESWPAESGVAYYEIQRAPVASGTFSVIDHTADWVVTYIDSGIRGEYRYQVVAVDGAGNRGEPSPVVTGRPT